jgi:hypothetical protein
VKVAQAQLFNLLRSQYQRRDELRLVIQYRRKYIDTLMLGGEEEAEEIKPEFQEARMLSKLDALTQLRESSGYELFRLSEQKPEFIREIADQQAKDIEAEIVELEIEANQIAEEIENLTGTADAPGA